MRPKLLRSSAMLPPKVSLNRGSRNSLTGTNIEDRWLCRNFGDEVIFSIRLCRPSWASGRKTHMENLGILFSCIQSKSGEDLSTSIVLYGSLSTLNPS
jgi:hypothetical protein